jgi:hypothetical protein
MATPTLFGQPDVQSNADIAVRRTAEITCTVGSTSASWAAAAVNQELDCAALSSNECVDCGKRNATGNQIPAPPNASHNWLSLRRLGGQLAGRLDPEPAWLSGDGRARSTLRKANELSPWCRWIASGFSRPASRSCPATAVSLEASAPQHYGIGRPFESHDESSCPLAI